LRRVITHKTGVKVVSRLADLATPFQVVMSALEPDTAELAQLLMNAAANLSALDGARRPLVPAGIPIRRGRLHLGRLRSFLEGTDTVAVSVGFASAAWVGPRTAPAPNLGRLGYRSETHVDERGRLVLDLRVRNWLGVANPLAFEVVVVPATPAGLLVIPVEDFAHRWEALNR
jgi:hypothetical protein